MTTRGVNDLSERIRRMNKESNIADICKLMVEYSISTGDLIEYLSTHGSETKSDSDRLREINQVRKAGNERLIRHREGIKKSQAAKKAKKADMLASAKTAHDNRITSDDINIELR